MKTIVRNVIKGHKSLGSLCSVVKTMIVSSATPDQGTKQGTRSPIELFWTAKKKIFHMTVNRRNICNSKACTNTRLSWNYNQYKENKMSDIILCIQCFGETSAAAAAASNDETMNHRPSKYVSLAACIFDQLVQQTKWEKNDNRTLITLDIPPLSAAAITDFCITYGFIDKC